ncbi:MAG TPA: 2OG-Fe(II) oxygenase [Mucilaginibacter sp.]|nr:2OG-Fe(II) oxygenase [Mucilaginibacter sp.]
MVVTNTFIDDTKIQSYREEYAHTNCIFLPGFLSRGALNSLLKKLDNVQFQTKLEMDERNKFGKVLFVPQTDPILFIFQLLINDPALFAVLEEITGCGSIGNFVGRVHRSEEGEQHGIEWHGDNSDNRLLAMTLGLGSYKYTGGKLQIRETGNEEIIREFEHLNAGDAVIFKISPLLQHRLTILETGQRTVGVGWFRSKPDFATFAATYLRPQ